MISFDFKYFHPATIQEAVQLHSRLQLEGLDPLYYAGGTEIISFARRNELYTQAVIDIKDILECGVLQFHQNWIVIGATVTLTKIIEDGSFPLLAEACRHIADHTNRNKITLGGNICGKIAYKEALLPLLLTDALVVVAGRDGFHQTTIHEIFDKEIKLEESDLLVQIAVDQEDTQAPFIYIKRTKQEKIDYPLVSVAALKKDGRLRVALSGVTHFPFRSDEVEDSLNDTDLPIEGRVDQALQALPGEISNNILGSSVYREFVLRNVLVELLTKFEGVR